MAKTVNYKRVYCKFFSYYENEDEYISSEISGLRAQDIHHIYPKQMGGKKTFTHDGKEYDINAIENLIALTRKEHTAAHDPTNKDHKTKDELWEIHKKRIYSEVNIGKSKMQ